MAAVTTCSDFGAQENKMSLLPHFLLLSAMKWWDQMPWSSFFECWLLSQLFHSPLSPLSRGSLVPFHFLPLGWCRLHIGEGNGTPLQYSCLENPWTEESGGLRSIGSLQVGHNWVTSLSLFTFPHWRTKWQPTPVFLPGESQRRGSLVGFRLWGRTESDTTEAT